MLHIALLAMMRREKATMLGRAVPRGAESLRVLRFKPRGPFKVSVFMVAIQVRIDR